MTDLSRRRFLASAAGLAAAVPLSQLVCSQARAADLPHLDPADATAKALAYTNDASKVTGDAMYKPNSKCGNCALFQAKEVNKDGWAPCAAFPGKAVNQKGWCHAWSGMS